MYKSEHFPTVMWRHWQTRTIRYSDTVTITHKLRERPYTAISVKSYINYIYFRVISYQSLAANYKSRKKGFSVPLPTRICVCVVYTFALSYRTPFLSLILSLSVHYYDVTVRPIFIPNDFVRRKSHSNISRLRCIFPQFILRNGRAERAVAVGKLSSLYTSWNRCTVAATLYSHPR